MKAKDAMVIGAVAIEKHQLVLNKPTSISARSDGVMEELKRGSQESSKLNPKPILRLKSKRQANAAGMEAKSVSCE